MLRTILACFFAIGSSLIVASILKCSCSHIDQPAGDGRAIGASSQKLGQIESCTFRKIKRKREKQEFAAIPRFNSLKEKTNINTCSRKFVHNKNSGSTLSNPNVQIQIDVFPS